MYIVYVHACMYIIILYMAHLISIFFPLQFYTLHGVDLLSYTESARQVSVFKAALEFYVGDPGNKACLYMYMYMYMHIVHIMCACTCIYMYIVAQ